MHQSAKANKGRPEYRAIATRSIEPKQLGLAGALQLARVDRRIGAKGTLRRTWLAASLPAEQLPPKLWLALERQRWGIENRTHYVLDVTWQEDQCRVRQPNAVAILGIFQRLGVALHQAWAKARPVRQATTRDWVSEHLGNRWLVLRRITSPVPPKAMAQLKSR